jgi:hypothetical protein
MPIVIEYGTAMTVRAIQPSTDFSVTNTPISTPVAEVVTSGDGAFCADVNGTLTRPAYMENSFQLAVTDSTLSPGHSFTNNSPSTAEVSAGGLVARPTPSAWPMTVGGDATIDVVTPIGTRRYTGNTAHSPCVDDAEFDHFVEGWFAEHQVSRMLALIDGKTPGDATKNMFSSATYGTAAPAFVRNPSMFAAEFDLSPISFTRSGGTFKFPAVWVTPNHALCAWHVVPGGQVVAARNDGTTQTLQVTSSVQIAGTDIGVVYFASPLIGVTPMEVMPDDMTPWMPYATSDGGSQVEFAHPFLLKGAHNAADAEADQMRIVGVSTIASQGLRYYSPPYQSEFQPWWSAVIDGDSSGPLMMINGGKLMLAGTAYDITGGSSLVGRHAQINTAMNTLAGTPQGTFALSVSDLSRFSAQ